MALKIGFTAEHPEGQTAQMQPPTPKTELPRRSVVQVSFAGQRLNYYNDRFDLHRGDLVYVEGTKEGQLGRVMEVSYNFKIKLSEYKRVIAVVDTDVKGQFFMTGSHFVAFDRETLPKDKVVLWYKAPPKEDDEIVSGNDDTSFPLDELRQMKVSAAIAERGHRYYLEDKVRYICIDGTSGYAIVSGEEAYEVEFDYRNGEISNLTCTCPCSYSCKHEFAAMLQLRETLDLIEEHYAPHYERSGYFAAISKAALFEFAIDEKKTGSFTL